MNTLAMRVSFREPMEPAIRRLIVDNMGLLAREPGRLSAFVVKAMKPGDTAALLAMHASYSELRISMPYYQPYIAAGLAKLNDSEPSGFIQHDENMSTGGFFITWELPPDFDASRWWKPFDHSIALTETLSAFFEQYVMAAAARTLVALNCPSYPACEIYTTRSDARKMKAA